MPKEFQDILDEQLQTEEIKASKMRLKNKKANTLEAGLSLLTSRMMSSFFVRDDAPVAEEISFERASGGLRGKARVKLLGKNISMTCKFNEIETIDLSGIGNLLKNADPQDPEVELVSRFIFLITSNSTYRKNIANVVWNVADQLKNIDDQEG